MTGSHDPTGSHQWSIALWLAACAVLVTAPAGAGQAVEYPSGTTSIEAYLIRPSTVAGARAPAVIVIHDNQGLTDAVRATTRLFAAELVVEAFRIVGDEFHCFARLAARYADADSSKSRRSINSPRIVSTASGRALDRQSRTKRAGGSAHTGVEPPGRTELHYGPRGTGPQPIWRCSLDWARTELETDGLVRSRQQMYQSSQRWVTSRRRE